MQVSFWIMVFSGYMPRSGIAGSYGGFMPRFFFFFLETVYFPSTKFPFWWKFVEVLQVSGRRAYDHSVVVPTHSVAWAVGAADQSSVEG